MVASLLCVALNSAFLVVAVYLGRMGRQVAK